MAGTQASLGFVSEPDRPDGRDMDRLAPQLVDPPEAAEIARGAEFTDEIYAKGTTRSHLSVDFFKTQMLLWR